MPNAAAVYDVDGWPCVALSEFEAALVAADAGRLWREFERCGGCAAAETVMLKREYWMLPTLAAQVSATLNLWAADGVSSEQLARLLGVVDRFAAGVR